MPKFHIVTDSSARLQQSKSAPLSSLSILANHIEVAGRRYVEDVEISAEELMRLIGMQSIPPKIHPPTIESYTDAFSQLSQSCEGIISIHPSRELSRSWHNARQAAQQLSGLSCPITVIDSRSLCAGQGMLVRLAAQSALTELDYERLVQKVRGAVERIYCLYFVESLEFLEYNKIVTPSRAILGTMLGIKPFLSIEEGQLLVTEKVRTRSQAIERLMEFLVEFVELDEALILHSRLHLNDAVRSLQDRLTLEMPQRQFQSAAYGASLAAWLGTEALGVVVMESEEDYGYSNSYHHG